MSVFDRFETQAIKDIEIDSKDHCDNYESVGRLKLIQKIRKAVTEIYRNPPENIHPPLEDLFTSQKIQF